MVNKRIGSYSLCTKVSKSDCTLFILKLLPDTEGTICFYLSYMIIDLTNNNVFSSKLKLILHVTRSKTLCEDHTQKDRTSEQFGWTYPVLEKKEVNNINMRHSLTLNNARGQPWSHLAL